MAIRTLFILVALGFTTSGCVSTSSGSATEFAKAQTALAPVMNRASVSQADLVLSCSEINTRLNNLYRRFDEIEKIEKQRQRQNALTGALGDVATAVIGGRLMSGVAGGGVSGLQTATAAQTVISSMRNIEGNTADLKTVTDASAISQRVGELERVKIEKAC